MGNLHRPSAPVQDTQVLRFKFHSGSVELRSPRRLTEKEFYEFCAENRDLRIEQNKNGNLIIMPPVDHDGGVAESHAHGYLFAWWLSHEKGLTYSPSTGFKLPDGSTRSADGAWASAEKIALLSPQERKKFPPLVPDFIMEVRSSSDRISKLKKKMTDTWLANGVRLAWLIDPKQQKAYIYRADGSEEAVASFDGVLSGETVCPGLALDLRLFKKNAP